MQATYYIAQDGRKAVAFNGYYPMATLLMHHIGAKYDGQKRRWYFAADFLALVKEEIAQLPEIAPKWCPAWPAPMSDENAKQIKSDFRYRDFPQTPEDAARLTALRAQHQATHQEPSEMAAQANAPRAVAATTIGTRFQVGEIAIVSDRALVCIACEYVRYDAEEDRESGWYADFAEPTAEEMVSAAYVTKEAARVRDAELKAAEERTWQANREAARRQEQERREREGMSELERKTREEAKASGMDLGLFDTLFGDAADD